MPRKSKTRRILTRTALVVLLTAGYLAFRGYKEIAPERQPSDRYMVTKILDGDTVELAGRDKLRLLYIDTPEKGDPFYDSAKMALSEMSLGQRAEVRFGKKRRDGYGRLLGEMLVGGRSMEELLLVRGYGSLYLFDDNTRASDSATVNRLLKAQVSAIDAGRGIWSIWRSPEESYVASPSAFRFHRPNCRGIEKRNPLTLRRFSSRLDACREGLSPCQNCKP